MTDLVHVSTKAIQNYVTPRHFVQLCAREHGCEFLIDLAADAQNARCKRFFSAEEGALKQDWLGELIVQEGIQEVIPGRGACWLNPPFDRASDFMAKCAEEGARGCRIVTLTLSSLGTKWYREHVQPNALSLVLQDRITFEGQPTPYPKELMVSFFGFGKTGLGFWKWRKG